MDEQADLRLCCYSRSPIAICHFTMEMPKLIFVKHDTTQTELLFVQSLQSICSLYVDTPRVVLLVTVFFIIQPDIRKWYTKHGNH